MDHPTSGREYSFTMDEARLIYKLYSDKLTPWEIKETTLSEAQIQEIAVAIVHARMNIQKILHYQRASFTYDPSSIDLAEYRVGNPSQKLASYLNILLINALIKKFFNTLNQ